MYNNLQIRNSAVEFLIFISQDGELDENAVCRKFRHTARGAVININLDKIYFY